MRNRRGMRIEAPPPGAGNKVVVRLSPELSTATHHNLQKKVQYRGHESTPHCMGGDVCNGEKNAILIEKDGGEGHCGGGRQCMLPNSIRSGLIFSFCVSLRPKTHQSERVSL